MRFLHHVSPLPAASLISRAEYVSTLPIPVGRDFISAQSASYFDGAALHVWYGCEVPPFTFVDDLYYTRSSDFINWNIPTKVIDLPINGIRDPTILVANGNIYLFCQIYSGGGNFTVSLYRIPIGSDYTLPANYTYIGDPATAAPGTFDANMVASPTCRKIGNFYYLVYEAQSGAGISSIGRAYSSNIEAVPYIKQGPLLDSNGQILLCPSDPRRPIVPCTYFSDNILYIHFHTLAEHWNTSLVYLPSGDFSASRGYRLYIDPVTPRIKAIDPKSATGVQWVDWAAIDVLGKLDGYYYFLIQGWNTGNGWPWTAQPNLYLMRTPLHIVYPRQRSDRHTLKLSRKPY